MSKKKFVTGLGNYHTVGSTTPSPGGTTNYNDLTNKPQINGQELVGNTDLNNTYYTKQDINNSFYTKSNMSTLFYNKEEVDSLVDNLEQQITNLQQLIQQTLTDQYYTKTEIDNKISTINSNIDTKTNKDYIYSQNKSIIKQGEYIQLTKDDANKTITIAQSLKPDPEAPTTGIVFKDDAMNDYVILNHNDVFDPTHETISGTYAHSEGSYSSPRVLFNPSNPIIVNSNVLNQAKNNEALGFFIECSNLNTPIDLSQTTKAKDWDETGINFMYGCINFNSTIKFNGIIEKISKKFMNNCEEFNNQLIDLFTPNLKAISRNFMDSCSELSQDFDFSNTGLTNGKINLVNFLYNCNKMGGHTIDLGNAGLTMLKKQNYTIDEFSGIYKCFASSLSGTSLSTDGINLVGSNMDATQAHDWEAQDESSNKVKPLQSSITNPFKTLKVNGTIVEGA